MKKTTEEKIRALAATLVLGGMEREAADMLAKCAILSEESGASWHYRSYDDVASLEVSLPCKGGYEVSINSDAKPRRKATPKKKAKKVRLPRRPSEVIKDESF